MNKYSNVNWSNTESKIAEAVINYKKNYGQDSFYQIQNKSFVDNYQSVEPEWRPELISLVCRPALLHNRGHFNKFTALSADY